MPHLASTPAQLILSGLLAATAAAQSPDLDDFYGFDGLEVVRIDPGAGPIGSTASLSATESRASTVLETIATSVLSARRKPCCPSSPTRVWSRSLATRMATRIARSPAGSCSVESPADG